MSQVNVCAKLILTVPFVPDTLLAQSIVSWIPDNFPPHRRDHSFQFHYDSATTWDFWEYVKNETGFTSTHNTNGAGQLLASIVQTPPALEQGAFAHDENMPTADRMNVFSSVNLEIPTTFPLEIPPPHLSPRVVDNENDFARSNDLAILMDAFNSIAYSADRVTLQDGFENPLSGDEKSARQHAETADIAFSLTDEPDFPWRII